MQRRRRILRWSVYLLGGLLVAAVVLYILASRRPGGYHPLHLSPDRQEAGMRRFFDHATKGFVNKVGGTKPGEFFTWTITAEQANTYLASIDAIASLGRRERVNALARMERAGLVDPAVAMGDGVLTIMGKVRQFDKIVSVDLAFEYDEDGLLAVHIRRVRVGVLPVPQAWVEGRVGQVREELADQLAKAEAGESVRLGSLDLNRLAGMAKRVVSMLDGKHVPPEITVKLGARHTTLVRKIEITEGKLTMYCHTPEE